MLSLSHDDTLQANPLFQVLNNNSNYKHLLQQLTHPSSSATKPTQQTQHILLVPTSRSMQLIKINEEFVKTHILKPSPYFKQDFMTLNGKTVAIKGVYI